MCFAMLTEEIKQYLRIYINNKSAHEQNNKYFIWNQKIEISSCKILNWGPHHMGSMHLQTIIQLE